MIQLLEERCEPLSTGNVSSLPQIYFTFPSGEEPIEIIQKGRFLQIKKKQKTLGLITIFN